MYNPNIVWINGRPYIVYYTTGAADADLQPRGDDEDEIIAEKW